MTEPTSPDPAVRRADTRQALGDPHYRAAFDLVAAGRSDEMTDEHRAAVRRARELTGTPPPGFPVPVPDVTTAPTEEDR